MSWALMPLTVKGAASGFSFGAGVGEHLEVHVPEPGDVAAVGVVVVYGYEDVVRVGARDEGAQDLVEAHGVFDQEQKSLPVPGSHPLDPPESPTELSEPAGDLRSPTPASPATAAAASAL